MSQQSKHAHYCDFKIHMMQVEAEANDRAATETGTRCTKEYWYNNKFSDLCCCKHPGSLVLRRW